MSEDNLFKIISNRLSYDVVDLLRNGPFSESDIIANITKHEEVKQKKILKTLEALKDQDVVLSFKMKGKEYYLLIKDFYIIRIPPKNVIEHVKKTSKISKGAKKHYIDNLQNFFANYVASTRKLKADLEKNIMDLVINPAVLSIINLLRSKPLKLSSIQKKRSYFNEIQELLIKNDVIDFILDSSDTWVVLKTDFNYESFFPEYLIKQITIRLKQNRMNKALALHSLYALKRRFLMEEKPEFLASQESALANKVEQLKLLIQQGKKPINKTKEAIKLAKTIGDFEVTMTWKKYLKEWKQG